MHKDCIILTHHLIGNNAIVTSEDLQKLLTSLKQFHICKVTYVVKAADALVDWIKSNRQDYGFAIDFVETDEQILTCGTMTQALKYADSEDVIVMNANCTTQVHLDQMLKLQQSNSADCTVASASVKNEYSVADYLGALALYKPSYLSLPLASDASFEANYLQKVEQHDHLLISMFYGE
ncbi:MAG: hypothetical protein RL660_1273 [Bacteroidota bacterium]|jgi:NDP-sugar pyrophosphorylase family protein